MEELERLKEFNKNIDSLLTTKDKIKIKIKEVDDREIDELIMNIDRARKTPEFVDTLREIYAIEQTKKEMLEMVDEMFGEEDEA